MTARRDSFSLGPADEDGSLEAAIENTPLEVDPTRRKAAIDRLQFKINQTVQQLREEQKVQEDNVQEYLELSANASKHQLHRIKSIFEKRNQKSSEVIGQLQAKLEMYTKRLNNIESHSIIPHSSQKDVLKNLGQGFKSIVSKPLELAHHLKSKLGHSDDISNKSEHRAHMPDSDHPAIGSLNHVIAPRTDSTGEISSLVPEVSNSNFDSPTPRQNRPVPAKKTRSIIHNLQHPTVPNSQNVLPVLQELQKEQNHLNYDFDELKEQMHRDQAQLKSIIDVEHETVEQLQEEVHDLIDLHQHEISNLKQELSILEEKLVYRLEDRSQDLREQLEWCYSKISNLEQQQQQQNQLLQFEARDDSSYSRAAAINLLINFFSVIFLILSMIAGLLQPFIATRRRYFCTFILVLCGTLVWHNWEFLTPFVEPFISQYYDNISDMYTGGIMKNSGQ